MPKSKTRKEKLFVSQSTYSHSLLYNENKCICPLIMAEQKKNKKSLRGRGK
jgi:hypothetical protein